MLRYEGVSLGYGRHVVLRDVSFEIEAGDFVGLVGPNGCGKSTLMRSMLGLIHPLSGTMEWPDGVPKRGYVPQREQVDPIWPMRVRDLLKMTLCALRPVHVFHRKEPPRVGEIMDLVEIGHLADQTLNTLSGGEMQRVLLARALIVEPRLVLLDEPTAAMDLVSAERFLSLISRMHENEKMTVVMVTHDLPSLVNRARRLGIIQDGTLHSGKTEDLLTSENLTRIYKEPLTVCKVDGRTIVCQGTFAVKERSLP